MLNSIAILRLSALGDICHALPAIRSIQAQYPEIELTWIVGKTEYSLVHDIPSIRFVVFDKKKGLSGLANVRKAIKGKQFDALLHMQTSLRSNILSLVINAKRKIGFDTAHSREFHSLAINERIEDGGRQHQVDDFFQFAEKIGVHRRKIAWDIPIPEASRKKFRTSLASKKPILAINPCSSPSKRVHRSWDPAYYAEVAEYATRELGYHVVLIGGPTEHENAAGKEISAKVSGELTNLIGQTTIKDLLAVLEYSTVLITSDSGPAHLANAVGSPVIALHAATNPFQTGPYLSLDWVINRYPEAIWNEYGQEVDQLPWGIRAHSIDCMRLIQPVDVIHQLRRFTDSNLETPKHETPTAANVTNRVTTD